MRRAVVCVVLGLLVWLGASGGAARVVAGGSQPNRSEARADAQRQVAGLSLPAGAREVASDPSVHPHVLGWEKVAPTVRLAVVDAARFWRVPGNQQSVVSWVKAHTPAGAQLRSSGRFVGRPGIAYVWFSYPPDRGHVFRRSLVVEVDKAQGGGSAVRADGLAVWTVVRPRWDKIPKSVRAVTVTAKLGGASSRPVTITSPSGVAQIVSGFNRARVIQPELEHCEVGQPETFEIVFRGQRDGARVARAVVSLPGCPFLDLRVGGRRGPLLEVGRLGVRLMHMGLFSPCARHDLALQAHEIHRWHKQRWLALRLVKVGRGACEVDRRPTVMLFGHGHRHLPTPLSYEHRNLPWLLAAPYYPVTIDVTWTHTCARRRVNAVRLSIAGLAPAFSTAIPTDKRAAPCRVAVGFSPSSGR